MNTNKTNILIVEDEITIAKILILYCEQEGFNVKHLDNGSDVVNYVKENSVDLILLDLMLPGLDGISICREIRTFSELAIIMITAKNEEIDRLFGLEFGADDYICKPFSPKEVIARIKTVLRRLGTTSTGIIKRQGFTLDPNSYTLSLNGTSIELTPIEFKIFELQLRNADRVFSRGEILNSVYIDTTNVSDRNIDTHIKKIRQKINSVNKDCNPIESVYGVGYKFTG